MKSSSAFVAGVLLLVAVPASAQSTQPTQSTTTTQSTTATTPAPTLTDLAKQAKEKKAGEPAKKTFTNDDLKSINVPPSPDGATSDGAKSGDAKDASKPGAKSGDASKSGDAAKSDEGKKDDSSKADPAKTEKYWRDKMDAAREDVRRDQTFAAALQSRINALTADFTGRDDPYQRAQIADDRQKAIAELDRVNKAIEDGNKAIAGIEEEARKAMVPAGWIR
jgi:hypothetical protein